MWRKHIPYCAQEGLLLSLAPGTQKVAWPHPAVPQPEGLEGNGLCPWGQPAACLSSLSPFLSLPFPFCPAVSSGKHSFYHCCYVLGLLRSYHELLSFNVALKKKLRKPALLFRQVARWEHGGPTSTCILVTPSQGTVRAGHGLQLPKGV